MDIISILRVLKQRLWILIAFPTASIICAVFFVSKLDKVYKSSAQIGTGFTSDDVVNLSEERTSNQFEVSTKFINSIESMKSMPVMSLVSYKLILHDLESEQPFRVIEDHGDLEFSLDKGTRDKLKILFTDRLKNFETINSFDPNDQLAYAVLKAYRYDYDYLSDQFTIYRKSISDFIIVEFLSEDPTLSAFAVNTLSQEFIRFNKALKTDRSSESIVFLQQLVEEKRRGRDEKSAALSTFKVSNNIYNYSAESENKIVQISTYESNREIEAKNVASLNFSLSTVLNKIKSLTLIDQQEVSKVNQRIIDLRKRISDLSTKNDESSKLMASQLRDELQLEIARLDKMNRTSDFTEYEALVKERDRLELDLKIGNANLQTIEETLSRLRSSITGFAAKEAKLAELERDLQIVSAEYQSAQEKYNSAIDKASVIGSSLRQVIQGQPSNEPESSKRILLVAFAGIGSFIICVISILLVEVANLSIRNQARLEKFTGIKNLATLNQTTLNLTDLPKVFHSKNKDGNLDMFIHILRKLRFEIQNTEDQIILITSTKPNVGKTFIIISLSYSLSLLNKRILIIDTNFKSSSLTKLLMPNASVQGLLKKGVVTDNFLLLEEYSNGSKASDLKESLPKNDERNLIHETKFKGIDIIGNFGGKDSPSEIFAGKDFGKMLDSLVLRYDYIIMEGPSLNEYSDTRELVGYVDKVIPVFDAQTTLTNLDHESINYLKGTKDKVLGTILNNAKVNDLSV